MTMSLTVPFEVPNGNVDEELREPSDSNKIAGCVGRHFGITCLKYICDGYSVDNISISFGMYALSFIYALHI